jgi:hypothetical protein
MQGSVKVCEGVPDLKEKVKFRVLMPKSHRHLNKEEHCIDDSLLTPASAEDERVHVIWEIDQDKVEAWFEKSVEVNEETGFANNMLISVEDEEVGKKEGSGEGPDNQDGNPQDDQDNDEDVGEANQEYETEEGSPHSLDDVDALALTLVDDDIDRQALLLNRQIEPEAFGSEQDRAEIKPFIEDGLRGEYYSLTHKRWIPAIIKIPPISGLYLDDVPAVQYDVQLGKLARDQLRSDVHLDCIRRPLERGELVEVFIRRRPARERTATRKANDDLMATGLSSPGDAGLSDTITSEAVVAPATPMSIVPAAPSSGTHSHWRWEPGQINGPQSKSATTLGYQVRLVLTNEVLEMIPATDLRLRYPPGCKILVYRGPEQGWIKANVDDSAPEDGMGATSFPAGSALDPMSSSVPQSPTSPETMQIQPSPPEAFQQDLPVHSEKQPTQKQPLKSQTHVDLDPWVLVPVRFDDSSVTLVPSYNLRQWNRWHDEPSNRKRVGL